MTESIHQKAKELFAEVCDLPASECEKRLAECAASSPELVKEVRSLLAFHDGNSLFIADPPSPKVRTRSTLSTTFQSRTRFWIRNLLRSFAVCVPILMAGLFIGHLTNKNLQLSLRNSIASRLSEQMDQRMRQLLEWERSQIAKAELWISQPVFLELVRDIIPAQQITTGDSGTIVSSANSIDPLLNDLHNHLSAVAGEKVDYAIWDQRMMLLAASGTRPPTDRLATPELAQVLAPALRGQSRLFLPNAGSPGWKDSEISREFRGICMALALRESSGEILGAVIIRTFGLERGFGDLLKHWNRSSTVSETYLISDRGVMLTDSRYSDTLGQLDLPRLSTAIDSGSASMETGKNDEFPSKAGALAKPIEPTQSTIPLPSNLAGQLLVRDPGVNLLSGQQSSYTPTAWPPTLMSLQVTSGNNGLSVDGYRNYVGQPVVGAWRWIPQLQVGMAIEEHFDDAFALARTVQRSIWGLTALFALSIAGVTLWSFMRFGKSGLRDISDVGAYQVQELLGQGGMGRVYLAEHALLCRQSAVKVLSGPDIDMSAISRFEREVQLASQLTHPNTISIYDFGRNNEGLFYYAMEYINGSHLGQLVEYSGPIRPGRCIYILSQLCRALSEAHHVGVVHRDIKPQNVMVCNRGGEPDFVKLFDYGLVKAFAPGVTPTASQTKIVVGTPRFMAPERLSSPWLADPRVDIYSIGALAYYLLTAKLPPLFTLASEASHDHPGIETLDLPASAVEFGDLLGICLSPDPANRPSSMKSLLDALEELSEQFPWSRQDSVVWWSKHELKLLQFVKSKRKKLIAQLSAH